MRPISPVSALYIGIVSGRVWLWRLCFPVAALFLIQLVTTWSFGWPGKAVTLRVPFSASPWDEANTLSSVCAWSGVADLALRLLPRLLGTIALAGSFRDDAVVIGTRRLRSWPGGSSTPRLVLEARACDDGRPLFVLPEAGDRNGTPRAGDRIPVARSRLDRSVARRLPFG